MARTTAGYSGTPLSRKLGIEAGTRICVIGAPSNYLALVGPLPAGASIGARVTSRTDLIHVFTIFRSELQASLRQIVSSMKPAAAIWVSWPKKSSKVKTDVTEDVIRDIALPMGLVDIKVCAVDEVWSGLKLVLRKENRPGLKSKRKQARRSSTLSSLR